MSHKMFFLNFITLISFSVFMYTSPRLPHVSTLDKLDPKVEDVKKSVKESGNWTDFVCCPAGVIFCTVCYCFPVETTGCVATALCSASCYTGAKYIPAMCQVIKHIK